MKLRLVKKINEAKDIRSFFWEPSVNIKYQPGQYYYFTLNNLPISDKRGPTRHFTISSSPTQGNLLRITTKIRPSSGFKNLLDQLPLGTVIEGEGPNGTFILDENEPGNHVFLTGGIGVTPFVSFIKYNLDKGLNNNITMIYSNSYPDEIAFKNDLVRWSAHERVSVFFTITKKQRFGTNWSGTMGRIDENMIQKLVKDVKNNKYWISGPPEMVNSMKDILKKMKITSSKVRTEKFTGY